MDTQKSSRLKRPRYPMPALIKDALLQRGMMEAYRSRPEYQQNDYVGWISRTKKKETQEKRLAQILDELAQGDKYMNMAYRSKKLAEKRSLH